MTDCECVKARVAALEERINAVDKALEKAESNISERFVAHNEFREQLNTERRDYVTKVELRWIIGAVIAIIGIVVAFFSARL